MAHWMAELPLAAREKPLITLAIPGSHHSASCYLKEENEITADQPWCVRVLNSNEIIRKAVYNWSKDQKLTITEQLETGVRYLDLNIAYFRDSITIIHGLTCCEARDLFKEILDFINIHPKEVLIIDINRFYDFNEEHHEKLFNLLDTMFGDKLIHQPSTVRSILSCSLNKIWNGNGRVIVFYQKPVPSSSVNEINGHAGPSEVLKLPNHVWSRQFIKNPWPRTEDARKMVEEVSEIIREREIENGFLACQAIVTLTVNSVIRQPTGTFEARYARHATHALVQWLRENGYHHRSNINIIVADFVDEDDFCKVVIDLNN
ncbi:unnamed protein product [Dracunculus medinensis]|uniref:PLCXc domain-containing protein n=1 Tax=Dracunculus medinensis TaxID=318479 RepID=A0A0N4UJM2_DRAME|nr:unnamed protein product [Dracunculus medinensis]